MPGVNLKNFGGVTPRHNRALPTVPASVAENVKLWHGTLAPFREPKVVETVGGADCPRTIHRYGCCWFVWEDCCVSVAGGLPECPRLFVTGWKLAPYPMTAALPDDGSCACEWKRLGVPKPVGPLIISVPPLEAPAGAPIAGVQIKRETRNYVYTYVNSFGEEGPPSDPIPLDIDGDEGATVDVTIPGAPLAAGWDIVAVRLYRVGTGFDTTGTEDHFGEFFFVLETPIAASQITVQDSVRSDLLGEPVQTRFFEPPPANLKNITALPDGTLCGSVGSKLWFSEPWNFHAWPCVHDLDDTIEAIVYAAGALYVATDGHPYVVGDASKDVRCLRQIARYPESLPCVSAKSMTATPTGCIYASRDGLVRMIGNAAQVDTHQVMAEDDWSAFLPHTMIGIAHDGRYYGFSASGGFIFDFRDGVYADGDTGNRGDMTTLTLTPVALHRTRDDKLYMAFARRSDMVGAVIAEWDAGDTFMNYRWRSKLDVAPGHINFAAAKVVLEGFPWPKQSGAGVRMALVADDRTIFHREVRHSRGFRLPHGMRHFDFQIEIEGTDEVREIHYATSMHELAEAR